MIVIVYRFSPRLVSPLLYLGPVRRWIYMKENGTQTSICLPGMSVSRYVATYIQVSCVYTMPAGFLPSTWNP